MRLALDPNSVASYKTFLAVKQLPTYRVSGDFVEFPDEYADRIGVATDAAAEVVYNPRPFLFDYQRDIARLALKRKRFAVFADCGLGKTLIAAEFVREVAHALSRHRSILIVSPIMVIKQTLSEVSRFYGSELDIERVTAAELPRWLSEGGRSRIGITNYEALTKPLPSGRIGALVVDESSMLKSHYGKWGNAILRLGRHCEYVLALTGTPAPNDRIEYANHAVLMGQFPTVNSFLARYFVNRGQTENRWELKPHAIRPFYRDLSHWCIFLSNPAVYGWKAHSEPLPPINVHIHDVPMTDEQRDAVHMKTGQLYVNELGGIASRARLATIAKGFEGGRRVDTHKTDYIRSLLASWPEESSLVWCIYNREQDIIADAIPACGSIDGTTPLEERERMIAAFKSGHTKTLVTKAKILGFGLNLQVATRQVFSGLQDSYENYYQCVKRSNRFGATRPLNVHIPVTEIERPMIETVLTKARRVEQDTREQEEIFKNASGL